MSFTNEIGDDLGALPDSALPAHEETGWAREVVWYGDDVGGDDVSLAYAAYYTKGLERCDQSYYVFGADGDYGVEEQIHMYRVNEEGENAEGPDETEYNTMAPAFDNPASALKYARKMAMCDDRWTFTV
jgi:hypothetical protein